MTLKRHIRQCKSVGGNDFLLIHSISHIMIRVHSFLGVFHRQWKAFLPAPPALFSSLQDNQVVLSRMRLVRLMRLLAFLGSCLGKLQPRLTWVFHPWYPGAQVSPRHTHRHTETSLGSLKAERLIWGCLHNRSPERVRIDLGEKSQLSYLLALDKSLYLATPQSSYFVKWGQSISPVEALCPVSRVLWQSCDSGERALPLPLALQALRSISSWKSWRGLSGAECAALRADWTCPFFHMQSQHKPRNKTGGRSCGNSSTGWHFGVHTWWAF